MTNSNDQQEGVQKFTALVNEIRVCMFITNGDEDDHTRPMATVQVDEDGSLWFFTDVRSIKVEEVSQDGKVHLVYAHPGKESYVDVWGKASVISDRKEIEAKWSPVVKVYFPKGADDPNLALLKVKPQRVYYWDAGSNRMTSMLKMAASLVTGNSSLAKGEEGKLSV